MSDPQEWKYLIETGWSTSDGVGWRGYRRTSEGFGLWCYSNLTDPDLYLFGIHKTSLEDAGVDPEANILVPFEFLSREDPYVDDGPE